MESDPYASPTTKAIKAFVSSESAESTSRLRDIVFSWEKLRIYYNLILAIPGLGMLYLSSQEWGMSVEGAAGMVLTFAVLPNLCYFLGPLAELYVSAVWQLTDSQKFRRWCFGLGLAFSLLIMSLYLFIE